MDEFVSTFTNRLDAKGRVSIPASFRTVLARDGFDGLYTCPTLDRRAVDAGGNALRDTIRLSLSQFEPFSEEYEQLSTTLIGESEVLKIDQDGRTVLSQAIMDHAGVTDRVTFVGQGFKFQIWEPDRFADYREEAKERGAGATFSARRAGHQLQARRGMMAGRDTNAAVAGGLAGHIPVLLDEVVEGPRPQSRRCAGGRHFWRRRL